MSPANKFWFNSRLKPEAYSTDAAQKRLQGEGFRLENGVLKDKDGNAVVFSIITNSGNKYRERMVQAMSVHLGWGLALAVFPVMYAIHRSYRLYFNAMVESLRPEVLVRTASAGA